MRHFFFGIVFLALVYAVSMCASVLPVYADSTSAGAVENAPVLTLFYSTTCPHCRAEQAFLDGLQIAYPGITIVRYDVADSAHQPLMGELAKQHGAEEYLGLVPLTFVNGLYFVGFDSPETTGAEIEQAIRGALKLAPLGAGERSGGIHVPILGTVYPEEYSLAGLAVVLGFLDGFNVCSLGALVLIIGLALKLQRRRAILIFGGTFILTTALVYGGLIVAWYKLFDVFSAYLSYLKIVVGLLALGGGVYFLKEYIRMRGEGAVCQMQESPLITRLTERTNAVFTNGGTLLAVIGTVLVFATVVAMVEFPCSAAVPVVFAGILADAGLSTLGYLAHIALFILLYMIDEIIIFGVAAYRLKLWMTSGTFTVWAVLGEALILLGVGTWYLGATLGLL